MSQVVTTRALDGVRLPTSGLWVIDPAHTAITAVARHMMVTKVRGRFAGFEGAIHVDEDPDRTWAEVEIDSASIDTGNPGRDEHLRSPDFLDAERFPKIRFRSTELRRTGDDRFELDGELTIRDVTKPVTLDVTYGGVSNTPFGATIVAFSASGRLDREDFGMTWNQALETGGVLVSKTLTIELEVQAALQT